MMFYFDGTILWTIYCLVFGMLIGFSVGYIKGRYDELKLLKEFEEL